MSVRVARPGDGSGIARVWLNAAAYYARFDPAHFRVPSAEGLAGRFENAIGCGGGDVLQLVAEGDGRVVGWLKARVQRPEADAAVELAREHGWTRLMVEVLIVDGEQWRRGTGAALLERAESWGRGEGAEVARLGTMLTALSRSVSTNSTWDTRAGRSSSKSRCDHQIRLSDSHWASLEPCLMRKPTTVSLTVLLRPARE